MSAPRVGRSASRIVAIVLPQLACEIARQRGGVPAGPLGVILLPEVGAVAAPTVALDAIDDEARRYGVRAGQKVAEAVATASELAVREVFVPELESALGRVAEVALGLGPTAALALSTEALAPAARGRGCALLDTVWLDVTGAAHLVGGEAALLDELGERVAALGHRVRLAIADGPRLAEALARWGRSSAPGEHAAVEVTGRLHLVAPAGRGAEAVASLPAGALPLDADTAGFFLRLGVVTVADLGRLPRAALSARLGPRAGEVMDLVAGWDPVPLVPYTPPRRLVEEASFEEGVESAAALLFVLNGMSSRLGARLAGRGEACSRLEVAIDCDRSIARLRRRSSMKGQGAEGTSAGEEGAETDEGSSLLLAVDLPAPLAREQDLFRALKARLERLELPAPATAMRLVGERLARAPAAQLDLSRTRAADPDSLPALLAELAADIGPERVGLLSVLDAHRPEDRSRLLPVGPEAVRSPGKGSLGLFGGAGGGADADADGGVLAAPPDEPTRLLPEPIALGRVARGAVIAVDKHLYAVERARFVMRLSGVGWWTGAGASRDYLRAWVASGAEGRGGAGSGSGGKRAGEGGGTRGEALVFVERGTGEGFLQGWFE